MYSSKDLNVIRDLCRRVREIGLSERHVKMRRRFRDSNDLKLVRPPLIIEEVPWGQMNYDHALDCVCENEELRKLEYDLRIMLFREKYLKCDNYVEPFLTVRKAFSSTGNGLQVKEESIAGKHTHIRSHHYEDVLEDERALDAFHDPVITAYPEKDRENVTHLQEIVGDSIPVVLRGHTIYYAPWDVIARLRGVEPIMIDVYDRPEYLHRIIGKFTDAMKSEIDQMEALGLYDPRELSLHCTPYPVTLPEEPEGECFTRKHLWFRTMAQMFSSISPDAHYEFDIQYSRSLAERFAYTYYGCCEPLHDRLHVVKRYANLRKVGVSPWADVEKSAEQIGGGLVMSRKPNPALVAVKTDPEQVRKEITETVKLCRKYGCPCDITLKDISTVGDRPENLIVWAETASRVLDEYYGEE